MIIELSGHGGVGKFTIGRLLAGLLGGRLLDNHTIYNPAFATTEFRSPEFFDTVRSVRALAFERASQLPREAAIILTFAPGHDSSWDEEWRSATRQLANQRVDMLLAVRLTCQTEVHRRRVASPTRALLRKLTDASLIDAGLPPAGSLDHCDASLELDVSNLSADEAAEEIRRWVSSLHRD
jgi:predicted kinase